MITDSNASQILRLLQITSPALPVGAYSYSEGIEYLCSSGVIQTDADLYYWLKREMRFGFISNETTIALRAHQAMLKNDLVALKYWNSWLSATRETEELWQSQSINQILPTAKENAEGQGCNYAIAFGIVAANLEIDAINTVLGYTHSWVSNLVSAAVRSVPFGQTAGQQVIYRLNADILQSSQLALDRLDSELEWCGWGASLASANHETQYSRLFRS